MVTHQNRMTKKFRADLICGIPSNIQFTNFCHFKARATRLAVTVVLIYQTSGIKS